MSLDRCLHVTIQQSLLGHLSLHYNGGGFARSDATIIRRFRLFARRDLFGRKPVRQLHFVAEPSQLDMAGASDVRLRLLRVSLDAP